jgi:DNA segregation ATPase FtsK/SpoIIIE, S-DNA-T family
MKKELIGIVFLFSFVLILLSLFSYNATDPSCCNNPLSRPENIHNLFGLLGAHIAGLFVFLFGLGSFWLPSLLLLSAFYYFKGRSGRVIVFTFIGGVFLILATGGFFSLFREEYALWGTTFSSGGIVAITFTQFLFQLTNTAGTVIILLFLLIVGFILTTGISFFTLLLFLRDNVSSLFLIIRKDLNEGVVQFKEYLANFKEKRGEKKEEKRKEIEMLLIQEKNTIEDLPVVKSSNNDTDESDVKTKEPVIKYDQKDIKTDPIITELDTEGVDSGSSLSNFDDLREDKDFSLPSLSFLQNKKNQIRQIDTEKLKEKSRLLEEKLKDFKIAGEVVEILPGPVLTTFEYRPAPGVKISKIVTLTDDLALALSAMSIRIVAPIPGKDVIGIEIPNEVKESVFLKELVGSKEFLASKSKLTLGLGKDILGNIVVTKLDIMPHLLIAGATGTGKSVGLNSMIASLLYKSSPDEVKFIMIDPKRIELSVYDDIPHLISPVVTDMKKATNALFWAVREMERRYEVLAETGTRNIDQYNEFVDKENEKTRKANNDAGETQEIGFIERLPYIVIIVDEFADLMMVSSKDVEVALTRLAQMARAAGMHLILATQRPSVNVLTGIIKANFPTRISFQVSSRIDSRTILDSNGSENLLGNGDMLFAPPGTGRLIRIQGTFVSEQEIKSITDFLKTQRKPEYVEEITKAQEEEEANLFTEVEYDEKYDEALAFVTQTKQASISGVQRRFRIGYNRAARIIETMEKEGVVGPSDGSRPREVLVRSYDD